VSHGDLTHVITFVLFNTRGDINLFEKYSNLKQNFYYILYVQNGYVDLKTSKIEYGFSCFVSISL